MIVMETLTVRQRAVLSVLEPGGLLTTGQIARAAGIPERATAAALKGLVRHGLVFHRGYARKWQISNAVSEVRDQELPRPLSRCQSWVLESLCLVAPRHPVTAAELAERLHSSARSIEGYLHQLTDLGLVRVHEIPVADAAPLTGWRPSSDGLAYGTRV